MNARLEINTILPAAVDEIGRGTVRIWPGAIDREKADRGKFFRGEYVAIINVANRKKTVRRVLGGNPEMRLNHGSVALDYDTRDALGAYHLKTGVSLIVRRATWREKLRAYWNTNDVSVRIANRLGLLGIVIALIPMMTTLISRVWALLRR
ncbi:MAG: hypothetical protein ACYDHY_09570 [Acidiferrobacterales bacterium]